MTKTREELLAHLQGQLDALAKCEEFVNTSPFSKYIKICHGNDARKLTEIQFCSDDLHDPQAWPLRESLIVFLQEQIFLYRAAINHTQQRLRELLAPPSTAQSGDSEHVRSIIIPEAETE